MNEERILRIKAALTRINELMAKIKEDAVEKIESNVVSLGKYKQTRGNGVKQKEVNGGANAIMENIEKNLANEERVKRERAAANRKLVKNELLNKK